MGRRRSESGSGDGADSSEQCAACGAPVDATEWHPVVAHTGDDGSFGLLAFCDRDCREAWRGA